MRKYILCIISLLTLLVCNMAQAQKTTSIKLEDYRWQNRLILLFAENEKNNAYQEQLEYFDQQQAELEDRDLLVFSFFADDSGKFKEYAIVTQDVQRIRKKYKMTEGINKLLLVGKDGGEKMRKDIPVNLKQVFGLIDQMPMRQSEMRRKNNNY